MRVRSRGRTDRWTVPSGLSGLSRRRGGLIVLVFLGVCPVTVSSSDVVLGDRDRDLLEPSGSPRRRLYSQSAIREGPDPGCRGRARGVRRSFDVPSASDRCPGPAESVPDGIWSGSCATRVRWRRTGPGPAERSGGVGLSVRVPLRPCAACGGACALRRRGGGGAGARATGAPGPRGCTGPRLVQGSRARGTAGAGRTRARRACVWAGVHNPQRFARPGPAPLSPFPTSCSLPRVHGRSA